MIELFALLPISGAMLAVLGFLDNGEDTERKELQKMIKDCLG